jgi:hypothetical protein
VTAVATASAATQQRPRIGWLLSTLGVWLSAVGFAAFFWFGVHGGVHGLDSRVYWEAARRSVSYDAAPGTLGAYLYPPPFALALWPLAQLPLAVFLDVWMALEAVAFAWLVKPLGARWGIPAFLMCFAELIVGNIHAFLAVMMVVGVRRGSPWVLALLTKVTSGVGLLWFIARRQWRPVLTSLGLTAAVCLASLALQRHAWGAWLHFVVRDSGQGTLFFPVRLVLAALVTAYAGRSRRSWLLPIALVLAQPVAEWMSLTLLSAVPRLVVKERAERTAAL